MKDFGVGVFLLLGGVAVGIGLASFVLPMAPPKRESPSPLAGYAFSTRSLGATGTNALYFFADLARCERQRIDQLTATRKIDHAMRIQIGPCAPWVVVREEEK